MTSLEKPVGLLVVNLGTPDAPDVPSVRRYLARKILSNRPICFDEYDINFFKCSVPPLLNDIQDFNKTGFIGDRA